MRLDDLRESDNVEDQRGGRGRIAVGGGLGTLVLIIVGLFFGIDPRALLQTSSTNDSIAPSGQVAENDPRESEQKKFVSKILASTEDVWTDLFADMGKSYQKPKLVLFRDRVQSACGIAGSAVGPFYCPGDDRVYLDLSFFEELDQRFGAPGDFAQAYVVAHEIGHHVQNLLGIDNKVRALQARGNEREKNALSVRMELQADFLAGVWAHHANKTKHVLEPGDVEEGLRAASAIGDDKLQRQSQGYVVPDAFTHGTSAQRLSWFRKGLETGDIKQGDTFTAGKI